MRLIELHGSFSRFSLPLDFFSGNDCASVRPSVGRPLTAGEQFDTMRSVEKNPKRNHLLLLLGGHSSSNQDLAQEATVLFFSSGALHTPSFPTKSLTQLLKYKIIALQAVP